MKILSKEYVYEYGKDSEEIGYDIVYGTHVIMDTDIPYTGIVYSKYNDGDMASYCFYKDGYEDGDQVEFYGNGKVRSWNNFRRDMGKDEAREFYENGILKCMGKYDGDVCLEYKIWDENGNLIDEKKEPTVDDIRRMNKMIEKIECLVI
jgi:antitoxin component YwqK of YwqJK toxin-antitoxin module